MKFKLESMKLTFILITCFCSFLISAQANDTLSLWNTHRFDKVEVEYRPSKNNDNVLRVSKINKPALFVFEPKKSNNLGVGIIVSPGGGYNILAIDKCGYEIAEWLNSLGYTAFVLQYSIPKKREDAFKDIQRAIRIVRANANKYHLKPNKIGVLGFSAGGHLSARAATGFNTDSYTKIDKIDDLSARPNFSMLIYPAYLDKGANRKISPELPITNTTPPFFIFATADDFYANSALVMTTALRDNKIPVEMHMLPKGGHGYGMRKGNIAAETWPVLAESWLNRTVKTKFIPKYESKFNFPKTTAFVKSMPKKEKTWVYLLAGQSNMAGRAFVEPQDTISNSRVLTINKDGKLIYAKEPISFYEPKLTGLDCGLSFGKRMLEKVPNDVNILVIPTAVGGSSISKWINDSIHRNVPLLTNFKEKVAIAKSYGTIKGILWHQGESDANPKNYPFYKERLSNLVSKFRKIVGNRKLTLLIGELGSYSKNYNNWMKINGQIKSYVLSDKNAFLIDTSDLNHKGDKVHFGSKAQRLLGQRYADAYIENNKW